MTISRASVATYLAPFNPFATLSGQTVFDASASGYGPDIDNALRELDYTESQLATATVEETLRKNYFALSDYFAARRLWIAASSKVDVRLGPQSESYSKNIDAIKEIMLDALGRAVALGYDLSIDDRWAFTQYSSDSIEPGYYSWLQ